MGQNYPPFPKPHATIDDSDFWEACQRHDLRIQQCGSCGKLRHPPRPVCDECRSFDVSWHAVPGTGEVYSWTTTYYEASPEYADYVPYSVGAIRLDGTGEQDVLFISHLVDVEPDDIEFGLPVSVTWYDLDDEISLPLFQPV